MMPLTLRTLEAALTASSRREYAQGEQVML